MNDSSLLRAKGGGDLCGDLVGGPGFAAGLRHESKARIRKDWQIHASRMLDKRFGDASRDRYSRSIWTYSK
jgi:hypothetical protein